MSDTDNINELIKDVLMTCLIVGFVIVFVLFGVHGILKLTPKKGDSKLKYEEYERVELVNKNAWFNVISGTEGIIVRSVETLYTFYIKNSDGDIVVKTIPPERVIIRFTDDKPYCSIEYKRGENLYGNVRWWKSISKPRYILYVPTNSKTNKINPY